MVLFLVIVESMRLEVIRTQNYLKPEKPHPYPAEERKERRGKTKISYRWPNRAVDKTKSSLISKAARKENLSS